MKQDFNMRLKQILFNSIVSVYYGAIVPCLFAQVVIAYRLCVGFLLKYYPNRNKPIVFSNVLTFFRARYTTIWLGLVAILCWFGLERLCYM